MHVHLIGVAGTGMGALAGLLKQAGHHVTGSDTAFYPPMGDALTSWGIETKTGFDAAHLDPRPDLVVVGNVCRPNNPEARAAIDGGMAYASFPATVERLFLAHRPSLVVAGTHGKTTTSALLAYLLDRAGIEPGFLVGGIPRDFGESFRIGRDSAPFVLEGDEYDSAFFEKSPKFLRYAPKRVLLTSIEHDHVDIYPTKESYVAAFTSLVTAIPEDGLLVAFAGDALVREVCREARCAVTYYALDGDDVGDSKVPWLGAPVAVQDGMQPFDLYGSGTYLGRALSPLAGRHNVRNALGALALACEGAGAPLAGTMRSLSGFSGVKRRQELLGVADGVSVYDDFAHHPTAVRETIGAIRSRHHGRVIAIFEPRSATASRALHHAEYERAFDGANLSLLAPVGRPEIGAGERLDVDALAASARSRGVQVEALTLDAIVARVTREAQPGDAVLVMSNGAFGGIHDKLLAALATRGL